MADAQISPRNIPDRLQGGGARLLKSWEALLFVVAIVIFLGNSLASPYFLDPWNLSDATFNFTEKAMIAFAMALVIISGEIDLSVASIIALASTAMGYAVQLGFDTPALVAIGLGVGLLCGLVNGLLITGLGLPSIVVTIGTMSLFRGLSFIVPATRPLPAIPRASPGSARAMSGGFSPSSSRSSSCAVIYGVLLHRTNFGRAVYAIGNNQTAALFSGVRVGRVKFTLFLLTGLMAGLASVCLTSRLGSTRPSIALGWELEVVTMVVLGGVNILGGSGTIPGVVLAALIMGMVTFGFGLLNVPGIVMSIFIGLLLISVIALPILWQRARRRPVH